MILIWQSHHDTSPATTYYLIVIRYILNILLFPFGDLFELDNKSNCDDGGNISINSSSSSDKGNRALFVSLGKRDLLFIFYLCHVGYEVAPN